MKHYHCDGCGDEIPETKGERHNWTLLDDREMVVDTLDVCKKCNQIVMEAIKKAKKGAGQ